MTATQIEIMKGLKSELLELNREIKELFLDFDVGLEEVRSMPDMVSVNLSAAIDLEEGVKKFENDWNRLVSAIASFEILEVTDLKRHNRRITDKLFYTIELGEQIKKEVEGYCSLLPYLLINVTVNPE